LEQVVRKMTAEARDYLHHPGETMRTDAERDTAVVTDSDKQKALSYWRGKIQEDVLPDEQLAVLNRLLSDILGAHQKVVLVDLPLPRWHADAMSFFSDYQTHKQTILRKYQGMPGFYYVNMQEMNDNNDFCDEVHPRPRVTIHWVKRLAGVLNRILAADEARKAAEE
jgi:hypothetical protein